MSARRQSYRPYTPLSADAIARQHYGERSRRDPADLTVLPDATTADEWAEAFGDAVLYALVGVLVVLWWPLLLVAARWLTGGSAW